MHTSELNDGEELNTKSVTEQSALDEFLTTAELAGTEFIAGTLLDLHCPPMTLWISVVCIDGHG